MGRDNDEGGKPERMNYTDMEMETALWGGPASVWIGALLGAAALWWLVRRWTRGGPPWPVFAGRCAVAAVVAWIAMQTAARWLVFETPWPWVGFAVAAGAGAEGLAALYRRELKGTGARWGRALVLLRIAAFWAVVFMLLQPVWVRARSRHIPRRVAVLLDDSASMHFKDTLWTRSEKLDMAEALGHLDPGERPLRGGRDVIAARQRLQAALRDDVRQQGRNETRQDLRAVVAILEQWLGEDDESEDGDRPNAGAEEPIQLVRMVRRQALPALNVALESLAEAEDGALPRESERDALRKALAALAPVETEWGNARRSLDGRLWDQMDEAWQQTVTALCQTSRIALAESLLVDSRGEEASFLQQLGGKYELDLWRFGRYMERWHGGEESAEAAADDAEAGRTGAEREDLRSLTDMTMALEAVLRSIPSEELAGVLVVGDGLHNAGTDIGPVSERLALQGARVGGLLVGGSELPFDLALADVQAPGSVYLGDQARLRAMVQATQAEGRSFTLRLLLDDEVVEEKTLQPESNHWRHEVRLSHEPEAEGVYTYTVELEPMEGELFTENNRWTVDVAVSDERTNVLLVDHRPRWEFRYLRNLFYGRDQSVHLQYRLTQPDAVARIDRPPLPPASAEREFGDAESGAWPVSREQWEAFDVIILGDLGPDDLTPDVQEEIRHAVEEQGALLVVIAGPRFMPHAFPSGPLAEMIPVVYNAGSDWVAAPEDAFTFQLTAGGRTHAIMQQSPSLSENESIWSGLPQMRWRFPIEDVKPGAEIVAYAQPVFEAGQDAALPDFGIETALARMEQALERQRRNALAVAGQYGHGRVLAMLTDRMWRLRYREGDTYHHQFWGQALRWGAGELLRDGDDFMRVGTDQWRYERRDPVQVMARITDVAARLDAPETLYARVMRDGAELSSLSLAMRAGAPGMYEGQTGPFREPGRYEVQVSKEDPAAASDVVRTEFAVVDALRPVEMAAVAADDSVLRHAASISAGRVVSPADLARLLDAFGEGSRTLSEDIERPLWSSVWLLVLALLLLGSEWVLRKKGGLT